jgi:hypothetical protein
MTHPNIRRHGVMVSHMPGQDLMVAVDAIFFQIDIMKKDWILMAGRPSTFETKRPWGGGGCIVWDFPSMGRMVCMDWTINWMTAAGV